MGDSIADLPVLAAANTCYLVAPSAQLRNRCQANIAQIFPEQAWNWRILLKLLRPHQWSKNALLFVPLILSADVFMWEKWGLVLIAAFCFSLIASAGYVINDLLDLAADRVHPSKQHRPFAAGTFPIQYGLPLFAGLVLVSSSLALLLPWAFLGILWLYLAFTLFYSFYLKRKLVLDVIALAGLFTHRLFAGGLAVGVATTSWLLAFSLFLFMSLAFLKRYIELAQAPASSLIKHRGYYADDLPMVLNFGTVSAYLAILVFAMYIHSDNKTSHYQTTFWLWFICPLWLYGLSRLWFLAHRRQLDDDPVQFVLTDRASWFLVLGTLILLGLAKL
jgi:4-hydroxybenzoate polyprenyltransferase